MSSPPVSGRHLHLEGLGAGLDAGVRDLSELRLGHALRVDQVEVEVLLELVWQTLALGRRSGPRSSGQNIFKDSF